VVIDTGVTIDSSSSLLSSLRVGDFGEEEDSSSDDDEDEFDEAYNWIM